MNKPPTDKDTLITRATPRDFLPVAALDRVAWRTSAYGNRIPDGEHVWRIWCEHALVFIAKDRTGDVVGAVLAFPCADGIFCLHKAMVAESQRGKGLGSRLFSALLAELDQRNADCFLTVSPDNANALKLYRGHGFTKETLVKGYYRDTEDRLLLTRRAGGSPTP